MALSENACKGCLEADEPVVARDDDRNLAVRHAHEAGILRMQSGQAFRLVRCRDALSGEERKRCGAYQVTAMRAGLAATLRPCRGFAFTATF